MTTKQHENDFFTALTMRHFEYATSLLTQYPELTHIKETGSRLTALHRAATYGHSPLVRLLIENGADVNAVDSFGATPLTRAALFGNTETAAVLLQAGANINAKTANQNETALHHAVISNNISTLKLLLAYGANPHARNRGNETPLDLARKEGKKIAGDFLESEMNGKTLLKRLALLDRIIPKIPRSVGKIK